MRLRLLLTVALSALAVSSACAAKRASDRLASGPLRVVPVGRFDFESPDAGADPTLAPEELSGITWMEGDRYLAIGDAHAVVHPLTIALDHRTGAVQSATFGTPIPLRDASGSRISEPAMAEDREGIALLPERREIRIANEQTGLDKRWPSLERYGMDDGRSRGVLRVDADPALAPFRECRPNKSFEALACAQDGSCWTANEDAATVDGPAAGESSGAVVRLLHLDPDLRPLEQIAYPLDPYGATIRNPSIVAGRELSGVADLAILPGGRLLVLERSFGGDIGGNASLRTRLYLVDRAGATDVSQPEFRAGLQGKRYTPVRKTLLWEESWGLTNSNFEGIALGPELSDGSRAVILVADNNGGPAQSLFTLRLRRR